MENGLRRIAVKNYRCLADVDLELKPINVFFGPNGAGKTTLLDAMKMIYDFIFASPDRASANRSHGIGTLWSGAKTDDCIEIQIDSKDLHYAVQFGYSSGRIDPRPAEQLSDLMDGRMLLNRKMGSKIVSYSFDDKPLTESEFEALDGLAFERILNRKLCNQPRVFHFGTSIISIRLYNSRSFLFSDLLTHGSMMDSHEQLWEYGHNLWSVLRNLHDRRDIDCRYDTIVGYMKKAFSRFQGLLLEQTGPNSVYASFIEKHHEEPIYASGISDGYMQLLLLLTALFWNINDRKSYPSILAFDEPEMSLHPLAISVFAEAVKEATSKWNKQVFIATHSPVLISQFELDEIVATEMNDDGSTRMRRVSDMPELADMLDEYAAGSLYMSEMIARQSRDEDDE